MPEKSIILIGPTSTGKTSLAIELCKLFNGFIISADSRQTVKYMNIGTGKVPRTDVTEGIKVFEDRWQVEGVDIFGYDLVDPDAYFSVYDYLEYCRKVLPLASHNGKRAFIVGGTGFYVDTLTGRSEVEGVSPDANLRTELANLTTQELAEKLRELDKKAYETIDRNNPARLVRAIEKSVRSEKRVKVKPLISEPVYIGLTAERKFLYCRSDAWVDKIFGDLLFEEVRFIREHFPKAHRLSGLIYKSALEYLDGLKDFTEAKQRAKFDIHAYIRRQQTWFKRNPDIKWFDISQKNFDDGIKSVVESELNG